MRKKIWIIYLVPLFISLNTPAQDMSHEQSNSVPFAVAEIRFEQNATDGDVEVVFEIKGGDDGLTNLLVISPDNKVIGEFAAPDVSTLGIRQFQFESPEPTDIIGLKTAYPEGKYTFSAISTNGSEYYSETTLSHKLPPVVSFIHPESGAENVGIDNLVISWTHIQNLEAYLIEIDQEDSGVSLHINLPGSVNTFALPEGFLQPGTEYSLAIGTVSEEGNISFVETSFSTAGHK